jgi:nitric oxide dioxygenase
MTPEQISIVRLTFAQLLDRKVEAGKVFYARLFAIAPETRAMFAGDIDTQSRKLMETLSVAIGSLRDPAKLKDMLEQLGRRHAGYGVKDAHYDKVGAALLWTLETEFGEAFTPVVRAAWTALYGAVADTMKSGAVGTLRAAVA